MLKACYRLLVNIFAFYTPTHARIATLKRFKFQMCWDGTASFAKGHSKFISTTSGVGFPHWGMLTAFGRACASGTELGQNSAELRVDTHDGRDTERPTSNE